jgi:hypothetical protein
MREWRRGPGKAVILTCLPVVYKLNITMDALLDQALSLMETAGATVVDVTLPGGYDDEEMTVLLTEFKAGINDYLASHPRPDQPASLAELIAYNEAHADTVMPYFGQELFVEAEATLGLDDPAYIAAREQMWQIIGENGIIAEMERNDLDAFVAPTAGPCPWGPWTACRSACRFSPGPGKTAVCSPSAMPSRSSWRRRNDKEAPHRDPPYLLLRGRSCRLLPEQRQRAGRGGPGMPARADALPERVRGSGKRSRKLRPVRVRVQLRPGLLCGLLPGSLRQRNG